MDNKKIFRGLVENALDYLEKSIDEFDVSPKFSLIHYCAAIELLLKARLAHEHWTLIACKVNEIKSLSKFENGEFVSINHSEAINRIESIIGENFDCITNDKIKDLFKIRNKLVHFSDVFSEERVKEETISYQLVSWHQLYQNYLNAAWKKVFVDYHQKLSSLDNKLKEHKKYLKVRFDHISPQIRKLQDEGKHFNICPVCNFLAVLEEQASSYAKIFRCYVCSYEKQQYALASCSSCQDLITMDTDEDHFFCHGCKKQFQVIEVVHAYEDDHPLTMDNYFEGRSIAHCGECGGSNCVLNIEDAIWVCLNCKAKFASQEVTHCDYCNDLNAGELEGSLLYGCNACDGSIKDD